MYQSTWKWEVGEVGKQIRLWKLQRYLTAVRHTVQHRQVLCLHSFERTCHCLGMSQRCNVAFSQNGVEQAYLTLGESRNAVSRTCLLTLSWSYKGIKHYKGAVSLDLPEILWMSKEICEVESATVQQNDKTGSLPWWYINCICYFQWNKTGLCGRPSSTESVLHLHVITFCLGSEGGTCVSGTNWMAPSLTFTTWVHKVFLYSFKKPSLLMTVHSWCTKTVISSWCWTISDTAMLWLSAD